MFKEKSFLTWSFQMYEGLRTLHAELLQTSPLKIRWQVSDAQGKLPLEGRGLVELWEASEWALSLHEGDGGVRPLYGVWIGGLYRTCMERESWMVRI